MTGERNEQPPAGFFEPTYKPYNHRIMNGGLPFGTWMTLAFVGMQILNFKLYWLLGLLPMAWWVLRRFYEHDEWGLSAWIEHVQVVLQKRDTLEV